MDVGSLCLFRGCLLWLIRNHSFFFFFNVIELDPGEIREVCLGTTLTVFLEMPDILAKMTV